MTITISKITNKNKSIAKKFSKREWKKFDKERNIRYIGKEYEILARENNKVVGYAKYKILGGTAFLSQIITAKESRGRGIGNLLLKKFEKKAKEEKCHLCYLDTSEKHKKALEFYKKNNYSLIATLKN